MCFSETKAFQSSNRHQDIPLPFLILEMGSRSSMSRCLFYRNPFSYTCRWLLIIIKALFFLSISVLHHWHCPYCVLFFSLQPTPCHYFVKLLADKGLLLRHFTQVKSMFIGWKIKSDKNCKNLEMLELLMWMMFLGLFCVLSSWTKFQVCIAINIAIS